MPMRMPRFQSRLWIDGKDQSHLVRIVVVGAGIVGAAVAYEAARAGAEVVLLDKSLPASGVTADSFAWIGGPPGADVPDPSTALRRGVLQDYRRLVEEVPGLRVRWRGALMWGEEQLDVGRLGPGEHLVDATEVGLLEPRLRVRPTRALVRRESRRDRPGRRDAGFGTCSTGARCAADGPLRRHRTGSA
jgi:glycine/D-amino acid oxidase-like deaminating enzyme